MPQFGQNDTNTADKQVFAPREIARLLRPCFAIAIALVIGELLQSHLLNQAAARIVLPYNLLILAACLAGAALTYRPQFPARWREITLIVCLFSVCVVAAQGVKLGQQVPPFVVILALLAAAGMLLPWEPQWQGVLTAGSVAAGVAVTIFVHPLSGNIALLWLATIATAAVALVGSGNRARPRSASNDRAPEPEARLQKVFGADVGQVSLVQLRGGRFINVNEELVSNLSHDLRTSLNAIMGMADLLADTSLTPEQRRYVDTVAINGGSLLDFINVMLDLTKIESGRLRLEQSDFDLEEIVDLVVERLGTRAHEKGLEFMVQIHPDVPTRLIGDPNRLRQVLVNLLDNAIKFTQHGEVVLAVEYDQAAARTAGLRFSVKDTGMGIVPDELGTIFQAFTRGGASVGREYSGSGIGLAIAQRLVELMGGRISVQSARGKGSTFSFTARFGLTAPSEAAPLEAPKLQGSRVLVVDDNDVARVCVREILTSWGAEVVEADGAEFALGELHRAWVDGRAYKFVLIDSAMPSMDGFEMVQALRAQERDTEPVVMMLTSDELSQKVARVRELGLRAYVVKPVMRSHLTREIGVALGTIKPADEAPAPSAPKTEAKPAEERPLHILLADDSPHNRLLIKQYLKGLPFELDMAENGAMAVEKFTKSRYDLVLMDLRMPEMDGFTAVRRMRQLEQTENREPKTPIVALSASALEGDIRESIEAGCTSHLSKPVKKVPLLAAIRELTDESTAPSSHNNGLRANGSSSSPKIESESDRVSLNGHS